MRPVFLTLCCVAAQFIFADIALAFPPAPYHTIHGMVRDEQGRPLTSDEGTVHLFGADNQQIVYGSTDSSVAPGENYRLLVPIDSATDARFYQVNATRPALPFAIRVVISGTSYVPMEMAGGSWTMGSAAQDTRLDLTLGIDSDGDGLPDAWERALIDADGSGRFSSLDDVTADADADGDGLTNLQEYLVGAYALDRFDSLNLKVVDTMDDSVELQFVAITGRSYRLRSSSGAQEWTSEVFATEPGGELYGRWLASDLRLIRAFVPREASENNKIYRLYVD